MHHLGLLRNHTYTTLLLLLLATNCRADQNTQQISLTPLGQSACTESIAKEGNLVAVARRTDGCVLVDVSNPTSPQVLATIVPDSGAPTFDIWDVQIHQGIVYLMNQGLAPDSQLNDWVGVYIYDANGPQPVRIGEIAYSAAPYYYRAAKVRAGAVTEINGADYAFFCSSITGAVEAYNVSVPSAPVHVRTIWYPSPYAVSSISVNVQGARAFVAWGRNGFTIHDLQAANGGLTESLAVSQPYLGPPTINGGVQTVSPTPDGAHLITGEYSQGGDIRLWKISPTLSLEDTWRLNSGALVWSVCATNDFAFVAHLEDGVQVLDIRDRTQLRSVGCFDPDPGTPQGVWSGIGDVIADGVRFYAGHQANGLYIGDFGDTVQITKAEWKKKRKELKVYATSSAQPDAVLEVNGFGVMTWKSRKNRYELKVKNVATNPGVVIVTSDFAGIDNEVVVVK